MKRTILLCLLALGTIGFSTANPIDEKLAKKIAKNFYWERGASLHGLDYSDLMLKHTYTKEVNSANLYYVFDVFFNDKNGFIIVAADDDVYPVWVYSYTSNYSHNDQPAAFVEWIDNYKAQILYTKSNALKADINITDEWSRLETLDKTKNIKSTKAVGPLLQTTWRQTEYYNALSPYHTSSPWDNRCPVGCVATAMAQIMKYWEYPTQGTGSHSYISNYAGYNFGTQTANFGATTYNWSNMPNSLSAPNNDVATLCYHVGVSVEMSYTPMGSGAYSSKPAPALINYFKYASSAQFVVESTYTGNWESLLKGELDATPARPFIYRGESTSNAGHSFICDGYQGTNHFHFVFGENSMNDNYFYLASINPGTFDFSDDHQATVGIIPIGVSIDENTSNDNMKIYPNPVSDKLFIEIDGTESIQLRLINVLGKVVLSKEVENSTSIEVANLSSGIYFIEILNAKNQKTVKKIIIE